MANPRISGTVNKAARNGKSFTLEGHFDDGEEIWYSAFDASQVGEISRGAEVEFECKVNKKGDRTYHNIQKNVIIHNPGSGQPAAAPASAGGRKASAAKPGAIPIDRERCIVRQNSVGVAAQLMQSMTFADAGQDIDVMGDCLLELAKRIEAHTSGDADNEAAAKEVLGDKAEEALSAEIGY